MCSQNVSFALVQPAGIVTVCASVSVCAVPYPSSQAIRLPECAGSEAEAAEMTPAVAVHGAAADSKPGVPSFWPGPAHEPAAAIVQLNVVLALEAPDVAVAVTMN